MKDRDLFLIAGGFVLLAVSAGGVVLSMSLTIDQIANVARNAGFSGDDLVTAVSVAMAESGGNPKALGDIGIGQGSFGLWQINSYYHPEYGPDFATLFDPPTNANAAFDIYVRSGYTFKPWSTFNNGAYAHFISSVRGTLNA